MVERERVGRDWKMGERVGKARLEDGRESWEGGIDGREGELGESGRGIGRLQIGGWEGVVDGREW